MTATDTEIRQILCDRFNLLEGTSKFSCRMIEPGIISYLNTAEKDVVLIRKETIDRCIASAKGNPLTIDHIDMSDDVPVEEVSNGSVSSVRYNAQDGWYYVDGVVDTEHAKNLIRRGYKPSCGFKEKKVAINTTGLRYHGFHYDKEITELEFHHLAIVRKPRFEDAVFRLNSIVPPMKNLFTLLLQKITRKNDAEGKPLMVDGKHVEETTVEKIELDGSMEVEFQGKKLRLNDLGQMYMDATAGVISDEAEVTVPACEGLPECKVRVNALKSAYNKHRKNEADAEKTAKEKRDADDAETKRMNSLSEDERKKEIERKNALFDTLKNARNGKGIVDGGYSTTAGSLSEKVAAGKSRY